jgi:hypothetical protein
MLDPTKPTQSGNIWLVLGKYPVRIWARPPNILNDDFRGAAQSRQMPGECFRTDHDTFLQHPVRMAKQTKSVRPIFHDDQIEPEFWFRTPPSPLHVEIAHEKVTIFLWPTRLLF